MCESAISTHGIHAVMYLDRLYLPLYIVQLQSTGLATICDTLYIAHSVGDSHFFAMMCCLSLSMSCSDAKHC